MTMMEKRMTSISSSSSTHFHKDPINSSYAKLLTDKQPNKRTNAGYYFAFCTLQISEN